MIRKLQPVSVNDVLQAFFKAGEQSYPSSLLDHPAGATATAAQSSSIWRFLETTPIPDFLGALPAAPVDSPLPAETARLAAPELPNGRSVSSLTDVGWGAERGSIGHHPGALKSLPANWSLAGMGTPLTPGAAPGPGVSQAQVDQIRTGLDQVFAPLDAAMGVQLFAEQLPLVGDNLKAAFDAGDGPLHQLQTLRTAIYSGLDTLHSAANYSTTDVANVITSALAGASISGAGVTVTVTGSDVRVNFTTAKTYNTSSPLESSFGLPGVGFQSSGTANTQLGYTFNFGVGVDGSGFYLDTSPANDLTLSINTTIPTLNAQANLALLKFTATDNPAAPTSLSGSFGINLKDPSGDGKLRVSELTGSPDLLDANFSGAAGVHLKLDGNFGSAALPDLSTDFNFDWAFSTAAVDPLDTNASFGSRPTVSFKNVSLGLGSFFSEFAGPVLDDVRKITEPLQPIVDAMTEPIPLLTKLHEIDGDIPNTLLQLAVTTGTISQSQADTFDVLAKVVEIVNSIPTTGAGNARIDLGDFNLGPAADPRAGLFALASQTANTVRSAVAAVQQNPLVANFLNEVNTFPTAVPGGGAGQGMKFPILDNPQSAFGLLLGKNVDLFTMDNATQNISLFKIDEFIRLTGPLGIRLKGEGNVRLDLDFGYDTRGLTHAIASGDFGDVIDGFYIRVPTNAQGNPISLAELHADLGAYLALNIIIAEAGAGGGIAANVNVGLFDPDGDRRVHYDEFIHRFNDKPLSVFDASGQLTYGLHAYVTIGFSKFSHTWTFDGPSGIIVDFGQPDGQPGQPILAHLSAANALLHIGPNAPLRLVGDLTDNAEQFTVTHVSGAAGAEQIGVSYQTPLSRSSNGASVFGPVNGIIQGEGGAQDDVVTIAPDVLTSAQLNGNDGSDRLTGGSGNDTISGGNARDILSGAGGVDVLTGEAGDDQLEGGAGGDTLDGGDGFDGVTYHGSAANVLIDLQTGERTNDAVGDAFISVEQYGGTTHDDTLRGASATDTFYGDAGNDILDGRAGDDSLEGGAGADQLIGGIGFDFAAYWSSPAGVTVNLATSTGSGSDAQGDTFSGIEGMFGSDFGDSLTGDGNANTIYAGNGNDSVSGGGGNDFIDAGAEPDTVDGGPGDDYIVAGGTAIALDVPRQEIHFDGFGNPIGGFTGDYLQGGDGIDTVDFSAVSIVVHGAAIGNGEVLGVNVDLANGQTASGGFGYTAVGFENIVGTNYGDSLFGTEGPNTFWPLRGGGHSNGATSGPDRIEGRGGVDLLAIDFSAMPAAGAGAVIMDASFIKRVAADGVSSNVDSYGFTGIERFDVIGSSFADSLGSRALGYDDVFRGLAGNDYIGGFGGSDQLLGGDGDDSIYAQGDTLGLPNGNFYPGSADGHDVIDAGPGDDLVSDIGFGANNATPSLAAGSLFQLDGGTGLDTLSADFSNQTAAIVWNSATPTNLEFADGAYARNFEQLRYFASGSGNDSITAPGRLDNKFFGNAGDDTFAPGLGIDTVDGGAGFDTLILDYSVSDTADLTGITTSAGNRMYSRSLVASPSTVVDSVFFDITGAPNLIESVDITGTSKVDVIGGTTGSDIIIGGGGNDTLDGYTSGDDFLDGGDGNDILRGNAGNNTILGGADNDTITPNAGSDTITAGSGTDSIFSDFYAGGYGTDVWDGGDGDDVMIDVYSAGGHTYANLGPTKLQLDGGAGFDKLGADFGNQTQGITFIGGQTNSMTFADGAYFRNFEQIGDFIGGSGNDAISQPGRINQRLVGGAGDDTIAPGVGLDEVYGGDGIDTLVLDYMDGDTANISGVSFESAAYLIRRDTTTNTVVDNLYFPEFERYQFTGTTKNDTFPATNNDDFFDVRSGSDSVDARGGVDALKLDWSAMTGGTQGANFSTLNTTTGSGTLTTSDSAKFQVVFSNFEIFDLTGTGLADDLRGLDRADILHGAGGNDLLKGFGGNDALFGGDGNDTLEGGDGVDSLDGGEGDDTLHASDNGDVGQWASSVIAFSSQYSTTNWSAAQTLGVPNTATYGDIPTAWAPGVRNGSLEQLTLGFAAPVHATGIGVRETLGNGFVTKIELLDTSDNFHTVFAGVDPTQAGTVGNFQVNFTATDYLVKGARISVDTDHSAGSYEEIDAVQLISLGDFAERLTGGLGNDTYLIETTGNIIVELPGGGIDEVRSKVETTLPDNVETLVLLGRAMVGRGNGDPNHLLGNDLDNLLDGGRGGDAMEGGVGNDRYVVDSVADLITENAGAGNDTVTALVDYVLAANVENLELSGRALSGLGNAIANIITGNARSNFLQGADGNDVLIGGFGVGLAGANEIDRLQGGSGADVFVLGNGDTRFYDDRSSLTPGLKAYARIEDFMPSEGDQLRLKGSAADYLLGASPVAGVAGTAIFHDTDLDGSLDPTHDEVIAIVTSPEVLDLAHLIAGADFV